MKPPVMWYSPDESSTVVDADELKAYLEHRMDHGDDKDAEALENLLRDLYPTNAR